MLAIVAVSGSSGSTVPSSSAETVTEPLPAAIVTDVGNGNGDTSVVVAAAPDQTSATSMSFGAVTALPSLSCSETVKIACSPSSIDDSSTLMTA